VKMSATLRAAFRWCCGCCMHAAETDTSTPAVEEIITTPTLQVPVVKSPPERRSSIPLHRKRIEASLFAAGNDERLADKHGRRSPRQLISSDIDEELDDDDDDDDAGKRGVGGIQFTYEVFCQPSLSTSSVERDGQPRETTFINSFYDFVSR